MDGAVHDAVVGEADRGHPELGGAGDHRGNAAGAIEQRVLGVVVEVNEGFRGVLHRSGWAGGAPRGSLLAAKMAYTIRPATFAGQTTNRPNVCDAGIQSLE